MTTAASKSPPTIKPRDRDTVINALRAGVVPRLGLQHIQVGRRREIEALIADISRVADGGAALRFVVGEYGAGKTFFLFLVRQLALAKNLVVLQADLAHCTEWAQRNIGIESTGNFALVVDAVGDAVASALLTGNILDAVISKQDQRR